MIHISDDDGWALASPLGGCGFAMACFTVGWTFSGTFPVGEGVAMSLPMALFFAGMAQFIAGMIEFARGVHCLGFCHGTYGVWGIGTAFMFYTGFAGLVNPASAPAMGVYWAGWAIITAIVAASVYPLSKWFCTALIWLVVCFASFSVGSGLQMSSIVHFGGWITMLLGLYTWYVVAAFSVNESFERTVLPVW